MEAVGEWGGLTSDDVRPMESVYNGYTFFRDGDVVVAKITPCFENGKGALANGLVGGIAFGTTELHVLRPGAALDPRFLFYVTISHPFRDAGTASMTGAAGQKRVAEDFLLDYELGVPSRHDQRAIADFLDEKTAAIDALIAKKERLIDLIEEKRQAAITRAVTKGLNPDVQMKDSGVEWLGEAPAHWEVLRLKQAITYITSGSRGWAEYYSDTGSVFLRIGNLKRGSLELDLSDVQYVTPPAGSEGERTRVQEGDVLFSITAYIGSVGIAEPGLAESYVSQHIALVRPNLMRVDPKWLGYTFLSDPGQASLRYPVYGGTKEGLGLDDVKSLPLLIPPLSEQKRILSFLAPTEQQTGATRESLRTQIQKLLEYRQILISAAVTGQIDVHSRGARAVELLEEATV